MRRLVRHGLAGLGAATFAAVAGVTALGGPATTTLAVPATTTIPQPALAPASPTDPVVDPVVEAQRAANAQRENREAERTRILNALTSAADRRASNLGSQSDVIDQTSEQIKAARAEAKAKAEAKARADARARAEAKAKARAEAAARARVRAQAAAEAKRRAAEKKRRAVRSQGYSSGVSNPRQMARQILSNKFGYGADQFSCFDWIIQHESNWNVHATNPSSGAYGLPQSLPGSKMASVASDWRDNPATQIIWGAQYMKSRYGSPCAAKSHWVSAGNY